MTRNVLLMILDGWGIGIGDKADAIRAGNPAYLDALTRDYPHAQLRTDGENVGLPAGQMGNSEVGHLNIGAGRVVYQDLVKINRACRAPGGSAESLAANPEIRALIEHVRSTGCALHVMGLFSDGGVHSSLEHLEALLALAKREGIDKSFVHAFMDGRDTDPKSGRGFVKALQAKLESGALAGRISSLIGRYYAMDRDKRWERVREAYALLVNGCGQPFADPAAAVTASYEAGVTDEFMKPHVLCDEKGEAIGRIRPGDAVVFINFRNDRAKELTTVLTQQAVEDMRPLELFFATMTPYDPTYKNVHVLFPKENVPDTIGEWVSKQGLKQLRIAETEKYAHVTFFLNGGREAVFDGEERILVPSPKVATYDLQPEMSAYTVADKLAAALAKRKYNFVCLNFANGDMVGHTGVYEAILKAVKAVDACVKTVVQAAQAAGYETVIIADHGNADNAVNADGSPNTAHSLNPVPIVVVSDRVQSVENGVLADVAPTVLALMGVKAPEAMSGHSLVTLKA